MAGGIGPIDSFLDAVATSLLGGLTGLGTIVHHNRERSKEAIRQLQGDPDDPSADGVLQRTEDLKQGQEEIRGELDQLGNMVREVHDDVIDGNNQRRSDD